MLKILQYSIPQNIFIIFKGRHYQGASYSDDIVQRLSSSAQVSRNVTLKLVYLSLELYTGIEYFLNLHIINIYCYQQSWQCLLNKIMIFLRAVTLTAYAQSKDPLFRLFKIYIEYYSPSLNPTANKIVELFRSTLISNKN